MSCNTLFLDRVIPLQNLKQATGRKITMLTTNDRKRPSSPGWLVHMPAKGQSMYVLARKEARFLSHQSTAKTRDSEVERSMKEAAKNRQGACASPLCGRAAGGYSSRTLWVNTPGGPQGQAVTQPRAFSLTCLSTLPAKDLNQERTCTATVHV